MENNLSEGSEIRSVVCFLYVHNIFHFLWSCLKNLSQPLDIRYWLFLFFFFWVTANQKSLEFKDFEVFTRFAIIIMKWGGFCSVIHQDNTRRACWSALIIKALQAYLPGSQIPAYPEGSWAIANLWVWVLKTSSTVSHDLQLLAWFLWENIHTLAGTGLS